MGWGKSAITCDGTPPPPHHMCLRFSFSGAFNYSLISAEQGFLPPTTLEAGEETALPLKSQELNWQLREPRGSNGGAKDIIIAPRVKPAASRAGGVSHEGAWHDITASSGQAGSQDSHLHSRSHFHAFSRGVFKHFHFGHQQFS